MFNKKLWKIESDYKLFTVDDSKVRNSAIENQDFCLVGTYYQFPKLIPKNEIWFSELLDQYELKIKLRVALKLISEIESGTEFWKAYYKVRKEIEDPIRRNHELSLKNEDPRIRYKGSIKGVKVWFVDGRIVRDKYDSGFHEGGHGYVYDYVPKDEIWIEDKMVRPNEFKGTFTHEYKEMMLMKEKGYDYNKAHELVSQEEFKNRKLSCLIRNAATFRSFIEKIKDMKKSEKRSFEINSLDYSNEELQRLCSFLKNKGFQTYISSGTLAVEKS